MPRACSPVAITIALLAAAACGNDTGGAAPPGLDTEEFGLTFAELTERAERGEVLIGECMTAAGFEYVPVEWDTIRAAMTSDKSAPGLSGTEFLAQYGFGISTQPEKPIIELGRGEDNARILGDLSEADRVAYERTLYGAHTDATWAYALESEDFSRTGGCTRAAAEQLFGPEELLATYFNPADALVEADDRMQAALVDYAACMSDAGFDYAHPDEVEDDLFARFDEITEGGSVEELSPAAAEELAALQAHELAVAPANQECELALEQIEDQVERELFGG